MDSLFDGLPFFTLEVTRTKFFIADKNMMRQKFRNSKNYDCINLQESQLIWKLLIGVGRIILELNVKGVLLIEEYL